MTLALPRRRPERTASLWWLSPGGSLLLLVPATLLLTAYLDDNDFRLFYRTPKSVPDSTLLLIAAAALVLGVVGTLVVALVPSAGTRQLVPPTGTPPRRLAAAADVLFAITMVGYAVFFAAGAARGVTPQAIVAVLVSQDSYGAGFKDAFGGVAGVSTLTQCGIAFVVVATYLLLRRHRTRRLLLQLAVVMVLTLARSFLASERLALVEIAVPAVAILSMAARHSSRTLVRAASRAAPLVLAPLLFLLFAFFEYSRSWQFFESRTDQPFLVFAALRLAGYYATTYNNGYLQLEYGTYPGRLPHDSIVGLWDAPGLAQLGLYDRLSADTPATAQNILERYGNPEFNNLGGLTTPFVDFGMLGGFVFFAVVGVGLGLLYRGFRDGAVVGALLYPVALTGLFDLPRYVYWTQGRVIPAALALVVVAVVVLRPDRGLTRRRLSPRRAPVTRGWSARPPARPPVPAGRRSAAG